MLARRLQLHQVDDVDGAHFELRQVLAQQGHRGQRFQRRDIPRARHHHVGQAVAVAAGPVPDAGAARAVDDGGFHFQVVELGLLAGHDHVHVVAAAQAVVGDREQAVGVRRQIDADHLRLLVHHVVDEAGILVREPVVVLPPDVRGEQVVERRQGPPPGDAARRLQPLGVLVEHGVDDVDEGLVAVEEAMPTGQ